MYEDEPPERSALGANPAICSRWCLLGNVLRLNIGLSPNDEAQGSRDDGKFIDFEYQDHVYHRGQRYERKTELNGLEDPKAANWTFDGELNSGPRENDENY
ncbi:hypothetical protein K438DRAFT_1780532 [Mycena galopus ATCC 62051]|nr:hypothetical protein K438DRAFT_1780532 [Mycena galopus ATCC 62051]